MTTGATGERGRVLGAVAVAYCVAALVMTFPGVCAVWNGSLLGDAWDGRMFLWDTWWTGTALAEGGWPLATERLYAPEGVSLAQQPPLLPSGIVGLPLRAVLGPAGAYSLLVLATFPLAGLAAFAMCRRLSIGRWPAFAAGAVFAFGPIRCAQVPYLNLAQSFWLPLLVWAAAGLGGVGAGRRASLLFGCVVAGTVATSYNLAVLGAGLLLVLVATGALGRVPSDWRGRAAPALAVAAVLLSPLVVSVVVDLVREGWYTSLPLLPGGGGLDLTSYLVAWPWDGPGPGGGAFHVSRVAFIGSVGLVLGALGAWVGRGDAPVRGAVVGALVFGVLSLGTELVVAGSWTGVLLPWELLRRVPVLGEVRLASRWALPFWVCWCILAARGVAVVGAVAERLRPRGGAVAAVLLASLALNEYCVLPFPLVTPLPTTPPVIEAIGADPRDGLVLEIMGGRFGYSGYSWFQIRHGRPVLEGQLSRVPPSARRRVDESPLLRPFRRVVAGQGLVPALGSARARAMAAEARRLRVRWVMIPLVRDNLFTPASSGLLLRLDRMVRECLPVRAVVHEESVEDEAAERALLARTWTTERYGGAYLWRVYELELPEAP